MNISVTSTAEGHAIRLQPVNSAEGRLLEIFDAEYVFEKQICRIASGYTDQQIVCVEITLLPALMKPAPPIE